MVIRKPYAFLIKNFKKIHIALFLLCAYIYYKVLQVSSFVSEFMSLGSYDSYNEPISKHINFFVYFVLILVFIGSFLLLLLLKKKNKPWKSYLIPVIVYALLIFIFMWTKNFFDAYTGSTETANIRMIRDLLLILSVFQFPVFIILFIRIFGIDLRKFDFNKDQEYLELSSEDREEFEISIDIDKESFKRVFKRLIRNIGYFYEEHKKICNAVIIIVCFMMIRNLYIYVFITNRSYKQGQSFDANGYTITINKSYYTDKDYKGDVISDKNNFLIIDLTIKNNSSSREVNLSNFHIMNGVKSFSTTSKTYESDFKDLGKTMDTVTELGYEKSINTIIIYRVDKKLSKKRFVLYYQELDGDTHLRKIKLKTEDISKIKKHGELDLGDSLDFKYNNEEENLIFGDVLLLDYVTYRTRLCNSLNCENDSHVYTAKANEKILYLTYSSLELEGKNMIDFSTNYGKIKYKDSKGKSKSIPVESSVTNKYYGKYLYLKVPEEVMNSSTLQLIYTVRNDQYVYNLKKG